MFIKGPISMSYLLYAIKVQGVLSRICINRQQERPKCLLKTTISVYLEPAG